MKIGRNEQCPCGSGKKYKKCHLDNPSFDFGINMPTRGKTETKVSKFKQFIEDHQTSDLLNVVTALQLMPLNHGKNIRIEIIAKEIIKSKGSVKSVDLSAFKEIVSKEFAYNSTEDLPEACFTENVIFFRGNYIVTPGITHYGAEIFRALVESIFISKNDLPDNFKNICHDAIAWLLELSKVIFSRIGLKRYQFELDEEDAIRFPDSIEDYSFSMAEIEAISKKYSLSMRILKLFIVEKNDAGLKEEDTNLNPLIKKPLFILNGRLYFVMPTTQLSALNEFILDTAIKVDCKVELSKAYNDHLWSQILMKIKKMGWLYTDINLPEKKSELPIHEIICRFDDNKLAYVCFINAGISGSNEVPYDSKYNKNDPNEKTTVNDRISQVINLLKEHDGLADYEFLTFIIYNTIGRDGFLSFNKPSDRERRIWFSAFEFKILVDSEKWNELSIWKFAKVYGSASENAFIQAFDMVDAYYMYKKNAESIQHPDKSPSNYLSIMPGTGSELIREAVIYADIHGAMIHQKGVLGYQYVRRSFEYAPIYKPIYISTQLERLLECYEFPLWIISKEINDIALHFINAVAFWLFKMRSGLDAYDVLGSEPVYLEINLDKEYFKRSHIDDIKEYDKIEFSFTISDRVIAINIPFALAAKLYAPNNFGERLLMTEILCAFNSFDQISLSEDQIIEIINQNMPLGPAKMILFFDTGENIQIDPRWLIRNKYLSEAEISLVLDGLSKLPTLTNPIPEKIIEKKDKVKFCNSIVDGLISKLRDKLAKFDSILLLRRLILIHEGYIQEREYQKMHIPAKIACFSDIHSEVQRIVKNEERLVASTLCIRCLIEFIAADPVLDGKQDNFDEIDQMMALMNQIISYGFLSDSIHLELDNPEIGLLPSGRIGTSKELYNDKLKHFSKAKSYSEIEDYIELFPRKFIKKNKAKPKSDEFAIKLNNAFDSEWGIPLNGILGICEALGIIAEKSENSVCEKKSNELISEIQQLTQLSTEKIEKGLKRLTLTKRKKFDIAPKGYKQNDIYPWKYNREFSFTKRPLVLIKNSNGELVYYWGLRNSIAAGQQILYLIFSGRLKTYGGKDIDSILGEINKKNGKNFRNQVKDWFQLQQDLHTIENEVSIRPGGQIEADKDYGDIDVCSIDFANKVIYSIECKDTEQAKNIHEMKGELDKYLEKTDGSGLIVKHVYRDEFLKKNKSNLSAIVANPEEFEVVSVILTSEDLPLTYIQDQLPLPFISFPVLKRGGISVLQTL